MTSHPELPGIRTKQVFKYPVPDFCWKVQQLVPNIGLTPRLLRHCEGQRFEKTDEAKSW